MSSTISKCALALVATAAAFLCTIAADRVASWLLPERRAVVFPADSRFALRTSEFAFQANVNSLGFRGPEMDPRSDGALRVLAIGDSSTYGWGVGDAEAWPRLLEEELRERGFDVEVANLGRPGAGPDQYAQIAEAAVPILKPDWIVVGLLQGDDLNQAVPAKGRDEASVAPIVDTLYPALTEARDALASSTKKPLVVSASEARSEWRRIAAEQLERLKPAERDRFTSLPRELRDRYREGDVNPYVVALAVRQPQYFSWLLDPASPVVARKVEAMTDQLAHIHDLAEAHHARVLAVSVPNWPYVAHAEASRRLGFQLSREMLATTAPDDETRLACERAGIEQITVTEAIRQRASEGARLFFPLDGHMNASGQRAFAETIGPRVAEVLASAE